MGIRRAVKQVLIAQQDKKYEKENEFEAYMKDTWKNLKFTGKIS